MNVKVKLSESPTIWLLKIDSDCFITETEEISDENKVELTDLKPTRRPTSKSTQTIAPLQISEKLQTFPMILKVGEITNITITLLQINVIFLTLGKICTSYCVGFVR